MMQSMTATESDLICGHCDDSTTKYLWHDYNMIMETINKQTPTQTAIKPPTFMQRLFWILKVIIDQLYRLLLMADET